MNFLCVRLAPTTFLRRLVHRRKGRQESEVGEIV